MEWIVNGVLAGGVVVYGLAVIVRAVRGVLGV